MTAPAFWVLNYLEAIERAGQLAPTDTMRQVIDTQNQLIKALQRITHPAADETDLENALDLLDKIKQEPTT